MCGAADALDQQLRQSAVLNDDTMMAAIIRTNDPDMKSIIMDLCEPWQLYIQKCGEDHRNRFTDDDRCNWIMKSVLIPPSNFPRCESIADLNLNGTSNSILVGCPHSLVQMMDAIVGQFQMNENGTINCDRDKMEQMILERYLAGRSCHKFDASLFRYKENTQIEEDTPLMNHKQKAIMLVIQKSWPTITKMEKYEALNDGEACCDNIRYVIGEANQKNLRELAVVSSYLYCSFE